MSWLALALSLVAGGCSGSSGKVSVRAQAVGTAAPSMAGGALDLGQGIAISRVRVAVLKVGLEGATAVPDGGAGGMDGTSGALAAAGDNGGDGNGMGGADGGGDQGGGDENEVRVGPFAVDLAGDQLAGGIQQVFDGDVPAGTYRELRIEVGPAAPGAGDAALAAMDGRSVIVDGTLGGQPFTFASSLRSSQKREAAITVTADGTSTNVRLTIDPGRWFVAAAGSRLDPTSETDRAAIEENIRGSIDAFDDDGGEGNGSGGR